MRKTSNFTVVVLCVLMSIVAVAPAQYDQTLFLEARDYVSLRMNIRKVLGVADNQVTMGIRNVLKVIAVSESLEKFYHGEYNDGLAVLAKVGVKTFSSIGAVIVAAVDAGTVFRDMVVKTVFDPQVRKFYEEYHKARMADLAMQLDKKKLGFNGEDFESWVLDANGAVADKSGSSDVKFFVDDKVIGPGKNKGLYNIAQMNIQDQRHSQRPWYKKLIGRVAPSEQPISEQEARDYWLCEWNRRVVIDGMEFIVGKKKQYIETFSRGSTITCVVEVKHPVKNVQYGLRCRELGWDAKTKPVKGIDGLQVMFLKCLDFKNFMEVTEKFRTRGTIRFELLVPDGKVVQVKDVKFADMMSTAGSQKFEDNTGIWREYRIKVDFDWKPPNVGRVGINLPPGAKLESLNINMGEASANLSMAGTGTGITGRPGQKQSGTFSLQQLVSGNSFEVLALLEQMQFSPESYLLPQRGSVYPNVSVSGRYKIPEKRGEKVVERETSWDVKMELLNEDNSFTIPSCVRPDYTGKTPEELMAIYKKMAANFIANPGTYPGDLTRLTTELPANMPAAWKEFVFEPANAKLKAGLLGSFEALNGEVDELRKKYAVPYVSGRIFWSAKQRVLQDLQSTINSRCNSSFPLPVYREKIIAKIDEFRSKAEAVRQEVKSDKALTEKLLAAAQRDLTPEIAVQRNLIEVSSCHDLPTKVSRTMADLAAMLADQDLTLGEIAQMETGPQSALVSFDIRIADLQQLAAAGAFYSKRFEQLQSEADALAPKADAITAAAIRKDVYILRDLLQTFNGWASGGGSPVGNLPYSPAGALPLDALYEYVTGAKPSVKGGTWPATDAMVEELLIKFHRLTSEEIAFLERTSEIQHHKDSILNDISSYDRGEKMLGPLSALYASYLSVNDFDANGFLKDSALRSAFQRAEQVMKSWRDSMNESRRRQADLERHCLATVLGPDIGTFIDICEPGTSGDRTAIVELNMTRERIEANMKQLATIGLAGFGDMVAKGCADIDELGKLYSSPDLAKAPWRERYKILREQSSAARTIGDRYADAMTDAIVRLLDVADKKFHERLSEAAKLSGAARDKELEDLNNMPSQGYLSAVGIKPLSNTQYGRSLAILAGSPNPGPFAAVNAKWSEVVRGWMTALEKGKVIPQTTRINQDQPDVEDKTDSVAKQAAYKRYMDAHNKMATLMSQGKGDTPEGREAYKEFQKARDAYNASQ